MQKDALRSVASQAILPVTMGSWERQLGARIGSRHAERANSSGQGHGTAFQRQRTHNRPLQ